MFVRSTNGRRALLGALASFSALGAVTAPAIALGPNAVVSDAGCATSVLSRGDDHFSGAVALPFALNFFGVSASQAFVNNNGNITLDSGYGSYNSGPLSSAGRKMIAPFFADVETTNPTSAQTTWGTTTFAGRPAFCVSWNGVGYYNDRADKLNNFQLLLVDRSDAGAAGDFDIVFNYDRINWEAGEASQGIDGFGGNTARAGYSNGTAANSYEIPGSATVGAYLDSNTTTGLIHGSRNTTQLGRYIFAVRGGTPEVVNPPPAAVAPALTLGAVRAGYTENAGTVALFTSPGSVADSDSTTFSLSARITSGYESGVDVLSGFGSFDATTGTISASGLNAAQVASSLAALSFANGSENPTGGARQIAVTVSDGSLSDTESVSLPVTPVNDAPVVSGASIVTDEDSPKVFSVTASDVDGPTPVVSAGSPANGTASCLALSCTYTPASNFSGSDEFIVTATDAAGAFSTATVTVTVNPVNDRPTATRDLEFEVDEDGTLTGFVSGSDIDGDTLAFARGAADGALTIDAVTGAFEFKPYRNYHGDAQFQFSVFDNRSAPDWATVKVKVLSVNDVPVVTGYSMNTGEDIPRTFVVPASDDDGDSLTRSVKTAPSHGSVSCSGIECTYTPDANYHGSDSVEIQVSDGNGGVGAATYPITVVSINDFPVAGDQSLTVAEDQVLSGTVSSTDVDGGPPEYLLGGAAPAGSLPTLHPSTGAFTYKAPANYVGPGALHFTVIDGNGGGDNGTVTVDVTPVDDAPVLTSRSGFDFYEGDPQFVDADATVSDVDTLFGSQHAYPVKIKAQITAGGRTGDSLSPALPGTTAMSAADAQSALRAVKFQAGGGDRPVAGTRTVTLTLTDTHTNTSWTKTVAIKVIPVNDPPVVAVPDITVHTGDLAMLKATASDVDGTVSAYSWTLPAGAIMGSSVVSNTRGWYFTTPGTRTVTVMVTDDLGATASHTATITVVGPACTQVGTYRSDKMRGVENPDNDNIDVLCGLGGNDAMDGGYGDDVLVGGDGNDIIRGHHGNDELYGGTGADTLEGYAGNDFIDARDNVTDRRVDCGTGTDRYLADSRDPKFGCETLATVAKRGAKRVRTKGKSRNKRAETTRARRTTH